MTGLLDRRDMDKHIFSAPTANRALDHLPPRRSPLWGLKNQWLNDHTTHERGTPPQSADEWMSPRAQVEAAVALLDGGATVPFIARYRKEATGTLPGSSMMGVSACQIMQRNEHCAASHWVESRVRFRGARSVAVHRPQFPSAEVAVRRLRSRRTARRRHVQHHRHGQNERRRPSTLAGRRAHPARRAPGPQAPRTSCDFLAKGLAQTVAELSPH
jgi:hypothetical protein